MLVSYCALCPLLSFVLRMFRCKAPSYNVRDIIKLVLGATMMGHWVR